MSFKRFYYYILINTEGVVCIIYATYNDIMLFKFVSLKKVNS